MDDIIIMRSSFIIVFKILRALDKALSQEQVDPEKFNADAFEATETRWRKLLEMLQEAGYIKGVKIVKRDFIDGETET